MGDEVIPKKIAVMMPFGGGDENLERRCTLEFLRIKHLVENKVRVVNDSFGVPVTYSCEVFKSQVGQIPEDGLRTIATTDILIGLVTEKNINVVFELAVRNMLKDELLLIVKEGDETLLPVYLETMAHISYDEGHNSKIANRMQEIAADDFPVLTTSGDYPDELKELTESDAEGNGFDDTYIGALERALRRIENNCPKRPSYILDLVEDLDPGKLLGSWTTYTPYSIVRIKWRRKSAARGYLADDMEGPPVVYSGNRHFRDLFDIPGNVPDPDGPEAITSAALIDRLHRFWVSDEHREMFTEDQNRLAKTLILGDSLDQAKVCLEFNDDHLFYANKVFLPCMIAKKRVGAPNAPHATYLMIAFIEDFWPVEYLKERAERAQVIRAAE